jgi:hypothetical protein
LKKEAAEKKYSRNFYETVDEAEIKQPQIILSYICD